MSQIEELVGLYYDFLEISTKISPATPTGWQEVRTPFVDMFNDNICLYVQRQGDKIVLSDDGVTVRNLELSGVNLSKVSKRKDFFESILLNYGIHLKDNSEMEIEASEQDFSLKKHCLISAISEANNLYMLAKHSVASVFRNDVKDYLDEQQNLVYTPSFLSKGSTGLEFMFDFQIAYKKKEILIKSFNSINKFNLPHFLFTWNDVKTVREKLAEKQVVGLAVINNEKKDIPVEYIEALSKTGTSHILWNQRHDAESLQLLKEAA
jgi:hypothetical protein